MTSYKKRLKMKYTSSRRAGRQRRLLPPERLEFRLLLASDFGDAPLPYPTTRAEVGAEHLIGGSLRLGANADMEGDGVHSGGANADDTTGVPDDEDGVTFGTIQVGAIDAVLTINVQGAPGKLDAWIDFDGDGSWGGMQEHIAASLPVLVGNNQIQMDVPSFAIAGTTYARFRLSTAGGLGVKGLAIDGEVEDYAITIVPPNISTGSFSAPKLLGLTVDSGQSVIAADVDGDGDMDAVVGKGDFGGNEITWFENDGSPNNMGWVEHLVFVGSRPESLQADDIDRDGDLDLVAASTFENSVHWYENDGSPVNGGWIRHTITANAAFANTVRLADIDGDSDLDAVVIGAGDNTLRWFENTGNPSSGAWTGYLITTSGDTPNDLYPVDMDRDGDLDLLVSLWDQGIAWYENDGTPTQGIDAVFGWTKRVIPVLQFDNFSTVIATDIDRDGDMDAVSGSYLLDDVVLYLNDGSPLNGGWVAQSLGHTADGIVSLFAADLEGDGDQDILVSASIGGEFSWFENRGTFGGIWRRHIFSSDVKELRSAFAADVDGDGDLDTLSASVTDDKLAWYENKNVVDFGDAPAPFATTREKNGARHVATGPRFGAVRDAEAATSPDIGAQADDQSGVDDEDGITLPAAIRPGQVGAQIAINVQNAAAGARVDAWIDFDGDGSWYSKEEQIAVKVPVVSGNFVLSFDVPAWAVAGTTYARFRISTSGSPTVTGQATDGEIEDHRLTIATSASASGNFDSQSPIEVPGGSVVAADIDGDGDLDAVDAFGATLNWYANDGSPENGGWTQHTITASIDGGADQVIVADMDADGDSDVLTVSSGAAQNYLIAWYKNNGTPVNPNWQRFAIHSQTLPVSAFVTDVDGDGYLDVVGTFATGKLSWFLNNGNPTNSPFDWREYILDASTAGNTVTAGDVDRDGDIDLVVAARGTGVVRWIENDGTAIDGGWTTHVVGSLGNAADSLVIVDVDGDGHQDVIASSTDSASAAESITWYRSDGTPANGGWTSRVLFSSTAATVNVRDAAAADVNGDGNIDIVQSNAWYENDGTPEVGAWPIHAILSAGQSVFLADINGDHAIDVLTTSWHLNVLDRAPNINSSVELVAGATALAIQFSEPVNHGNVTSNFELRSQGPDGILGNADDLLATVTPKYFGTTATLTFAALTEGLYRITVRDTITDAIGNRLDGDADGESGGDWRRDFVIVGIDETLQLVSDINAIGSSDPQQLIAIGNYVYFTASTTFGRELWKSDGTPTGTVLVKDINPNGSSDPTYLTNVNGTLFFSAFDNVNGRELWKSDGTTSGTVLVRNVAAGSNSSDPRSLANLNGTLYFSANDGANGVELWKSNGTEAGTSLLKNINSGSIGISSSNPTELTNVNGTLFFQANDGLNGRELWKSDGTPIGTVMLKDIRTSLVSSSTPTNLTNVNGTLFFQANDGSTGYELWKSDGTSLGTTLVKNISGTQGSSPTNLTNVNGTLYFLASDGINGEELWKSNGTSTGTVMVKDIRAGSNGSQSSQLINFNGTLFFRANDGLNGHELWKSEGISSQTVLVKDINAGSSGSMPRYFTNVDGVLFFTASDGAHGYELWKSDGTSAGTILVSDLNPGLNHSSPSRLTNLKGTLLASADSGALQRELWKIGPTSTGLTSLNGFLFDIDRGNQGAGQLIDGTSNAFDGLNRLLVNGLAYAPPSNQSIAIDDDGRTLVMPIITNSGLNVSREISVPFTGNQDFARTIDVFTNPTGSPISVSVQIVGNLGSDQNTSAFLTSDGDSLVEPTDAWFGTDDADGTGTPAIVHLLHSQLGVQPTSVGVTEDNVAWNYALTVPAGETVRLATFTILGVTRAAAVSAASLLFTANSFAGQAAAFLTPPELSSIVNFKFNQSPRGTGALVDGYYQLKIDGTKIFRGPHSLDLNSDGVGGDSRLLGGTEADAYFALFGDTDGDGLVGVAEFGQFRSAFGKTSSDAGYNAPFDYELDSAVGISDFGQFRARFGKPKLPF